MLLRLLATPSSTGTSQPGPGAYRASNGVIKFVDMDNGPFGRTKTCGFTITTWTLRTAPELEWAKDGVFQIDDLWSLPEFRGSPLPRWVPVFPVVSKQDPGVHHFILKVSTTSY